MTSPGMEADTPQLVIEAGNFDRISGDLTAVLGSVQGTAEVLKVDLAGGSSGPAVQAALTRFSEAAHQQIQLLNEISENIHTSGIEYDTADQQNADALAAEIARNL